ncbi:hypothetical protein AAHN97_22970 [Chitinophaga niabensis]|uniref:hypothetical protein n=1 Tax=Chitinophaga niabensis TaxID=536979 RepID=UPI0031BAF5A9
MKQFIPMAAALLLAIPSLAQEKTPVIVPYHSQNIRELYLDSVNHHTAFKTILHEDTSAMYTNTDTTKRSWFHRKLFKEHLFEFREPDFNVFVDFMPDFQIGRSNRDKTLWLNTRGARVQANIGKNFYFETSFYENQGVFPVYIDSFVAKRRVIPGQGEIKYSDRLGKSYDFAYVNALLSYRPSKYLSFTLGYGNNNFIGDGYRSLLLSDIGFSYPYLKITGTLGQFQYTSMWAQFMDLSSKSFVQAQAEVGYAKKWGVFHFLDWNASKKLTIGLFDAVIWPDSDSAGRKRGFDWTYMNPIIFLRPAEYSAGSSDNAMVGMNIKYKLLPKTTLYGQLMLDEFKLKEIFKGDGWWANKWSTQLGFRTFDLFKVPELDLQGELNIVRPYTYSFRNTQGNYAHYNQSLAHPMGSNFKEVLGIASYTYKRWFVRGQLTFAQYGLDPDNQTNYGQDIFKSYETRAKEYDNKIGQGLKTDFFYGQGSIAYVLNPKYNLRLEVSAARRQESNSLETKREFIFSFGFRSSFRQLYYDF